MRGLLRIVEWVTPSGVASALVGDLLEEAAEVAARRGRLDALLWLVGQLVGSLPWLIVLRWRARRRRSPDETQAATKEGAMDTAVQVKLRGGGTLARRGVLAGGFAASFAVTAVAFGIRRGQGGRETAHLAPANASDGGGAPATEAVPVRDMPVTLVLVLDRSGSMSALDLIASRNAGGAAGNTASGAAVMGPPRSRIELAVEGARRALRHLRPGDSAGILAFNATPEWVGSNVQAPSTPSVAVMPSPTATIAAFARATAAAASATTRATAATAATTTTTTPGASVMADASVTARTTGPSGIQRIASPQDVARLEQALSGIKADGPTDAFRAVKEAYRALHDETARNATRHVILLSDGELAPIPNYEIAAFQAGVHDMRDRGITLSTVMIANHPVAQTTLKQIASAGGGRYYAVDELDLPNVLEHEALTAISLVRPQQATPA